MPHLRHPARLLPSMCGILTKIHELLQKLPWDHPDSGICNDIFPALQGRHLLPPILATKQALSLGENGGLRFEANLCIEENLLPRAAKDVVESILPADWTQRERVAESYKHLSFS